MGIDQLVELLLKGKLKSKMPLEYQSQAALGSAIDTQLLAANQAPWLEHTAHQSTDHCIVILSNWFLKNLVVFANSSTLHLLELLIHDPNIIVYCFAGVQKPLSDLQAVTSLAIFLQQVSDMVPAEAEVVSQALAQLTPDDKQCVVLDHENWRHLEEKAFIFLGARKIYFRNTLNLTRMALLPEQAQQECQNLLRQLPSLQVTLHNFSMQAILQFLHDVPQVTSLKLEYDHSIRACIDLAQLPNIQRLHIESPEFELEGHSTCLRSLSLRTRTKHKMPNLQGIVTRCVNLEALSLRGLMANTLDLTALKKLKKIKFESADSDLLTTQWILPSQLERLSIARSILCIETLPPNLSELKIVNCQIEKFDFSRLHQLNTLYLLGEFGSGSLTLPQSLRHLSIETPAGIYMENNAPSPLHLVGDLSGLKSLHIECMGKITFEINPAGLEILTLKKAICPCDISQLTSLRALSLSNVDGLELSPIFASASLDQLRYLYLYDIVTESFPKSLVYLEAHYSNKLLEYSLAITHNIQLFVTFNSNVKIKLLTNRLKALHLNHTGKVTIEPSDNASEFLQSPDLYLSYFAIGEQLKIEQSNSEQDVKLTCVENEQVFPGDNASLMAELNRISVAEESTVQQSKNLTVAVVDLQMLSESIFQSQYQDRVLYGRAKGRFRVAAKRLFAKTEQALIVHEIQLGALDHIVLEENQLTARNSFSPTDEERFYRIKMPLNQPDQNMAELRERSVLEKITVTGDIPKDVWLPWPSTCFHWSTDAWRHSFYGVDCTIDITYHNETGQYYFRLPAAFNTHVNGEITLHSIMKARSSVMLTELSDEQLVRRKPSEILPAAIITEVDKVIPTIRQKHSELNAALQNYPYDYSIAKVISALCDYTATENEISINQTLPISQQLGVLLSGPHGWCSRRAWILTVLLRYFGVNANIIIAEKHNFCHVSLMDGRGVYINVKFTGYTFHNDTPAAARTLLPVVAPKRPAPRVIFETAYDKALQEYKAKLNQLLDAKEKQKTIETPQALLAVADQHPLLRLKANHSALEVFAQLRQASPDTECYYIESEAQLKRLLKTFCLAYGKRWDVKGPLQHAIETPGKKLRLMINWSTFPLHLIASYQSICENPARLLAYILPNTIEVFGLLNANEPICPSLHNRCVEKLLADNFFAAAIPPIVNKNLALEVDVGERYDWREMLFGFIPLQKSNFSLIPSALQKAIAEGRPLHVLNPNAECQAFLEQLHHTGWWENRDASMAKTVEAHQVFQRCPIAISWEKRPSLIKKEQITFIQEAPEYSQRIYLHANTLHQCFASYEIDEDEQITTHLPGILDKLKEQDILYLTGFINQQQWRVFLTQLQAYYPDKMISVCLAPGAEIEGVYKSHLPALPQTYLFVSDDMEAAVDDLAKKYYTNKIIDLTPTTTLQTLMETIHHYFDNGKPYFSQEEGGLSKALSASNDAVILAGSLSDSLYQQLLPYFDKYSPRLIWIGAPQHAPVSLVKLANLVNYSWNDYREYFTQKNYDAAHIDALENYCKYTTRWPHHGEGRPTQLYFSRHRLTSILDAMKRSAEKSTEAIFHPRNPAKNYVNYDYPRRSEDAAYMNVMGKIFLPNADWEDRAEKLISLIKFNELDSMEKIRPYVFRLLNCLGKKQLQATFKVDALDFSENGYPRLSEANLSSLWQVIDLYWQQSEVRKKISRHAQKRQSYLLQLLNDTSVSMIFLKGPEGVGKTHEIRHNTPHQLFEGVAKLAEWGNTVATADCKALLFLDEENLKDPDTVDFLRDYLRNPDPNKKIILSGNPEHYPGRKYHRLFQQEAATVYFDKPDTDYLIRNFLSNIPSELQSQFIAVCNLKDTLDPLNPSSIRDLKSLVARFHLLCESHKDPQVAFMYAAWCEFYYGFSTTEQQKKFERYFNEKFFSEDQNQFQALKEESGMHAGTILNSREYYWPSCFQTLADTLMQDECMGKIPGAKKGILIEGDSGAGKSTLLCELNGDALEVNAGDPEARERVQEAYDKDCALIIHEINLDPALEALLIKLMDDSAIADDPTKYRPNFFVYASQNPAYFSGRHVSSRPVKNRFHMFYEKPLTAEDLLEVADTLLIKNPDAFVAAYLQTVTLNNKLSLGCFTQLAREVIAQPATMSSIALN